MTTQRDLHETNRRSWNAATLVHNQHKRDQARWLADGGEQLFSEDYALLGSLDGQRVLHLQCNSGQDTLCLARRGAKVTGVDISDAAIEFARTLSRESGILARFERADLYDWLSEAGAAGRQFDVVYSSYGWLGWLSDLDAWARGVASVLAPGGRLVLVEFHPFVWMFDPQRRLAYSYFGAREGEVIDNPAGVGDYVADAGQALAPSGFVASPSATEFRNPHPVAEWAWSIADLLAAVRAAGLELVDFEEWDHANGCRMYDDLVRVEDDDGRRWTSAPGQPRIPMMLGLTARKPSGLVLHHVDAFTDTPFTGNPAAVCVLDASLPDATLQAIAAENNLSETAFIRPVGGEFAIRWFTPTTEVPLCGHATLAAAFVVLDRLESERTAVAFASRTGVLRVEREPGSDRLIMDFPGDPPTRESATPRLTAALGQAPVELWRASYWMAVFESEADIRALRPDFAALAGIPPGEIIVTAPADTAGVDFVSRFFGPGVGIDEDPVTGSAHCILAPYWAARLDRPRLRAQQLSSRGGELECVVRGKRVELIGRCVGYSIGRVQVTGSTGPE